MWYKDLFNEMEKLADQKQAIKMSKYMKDNFKFLGLPKPVLSKFIKPYLKESKNYPLDFNFIELCYSKDYREAQYIAIEYLGNNSKYLKSSDLDFIKKLIINKSWWETVDSLDSIVGELVLKDKTLESTMLEWSVSDNMWLKRVAIDFQQRYKELTNKELLEKIIVNNLESNEFFINKAIGWSLREYSKTNNEWVSNFINKYKNKLNKLSIKEASIYLK